MSNPTGDAMVASGPVAHALKSWPEYFRALLNGSKAFELRYKADRSFKVGDTLYLNEFEPCLTCQAKGKIYSAENWGDPCGYCGGTGGSYTNNTIHARITYILEAHEGLKKDFAVLGIKVLAETIGGIKHSTTKTIDNVTKVARTQMAAGLRLMAEVIEKGGEWVNGGGTLNKPEEDQLKLECNLTVRFPDPEDFARIQLLDS